MRIGAEAETITIDGPYENDTTHELLSIAYDVVPLERIFIAIKEMEGKNDESIEFSPASSAVVRKVFKICLRHPNFVPAEFLDHARQMHEDFSRQAGAITSLHAEAA